MVAVLSCFASHAAAQSDAQLIEAFSGEWFIFEPRFSTNASPCKITLDTAPLVTEDLRFRTVDADSNCAAPFANAMLKWSVSDGKIIMQSNDGGNLAELGGSPDRLSGDLSGPINAIILERREGADYKRRLISALREHKCYYVGYSSDCADEAATAAPNSEDDAATINVLVDLNVRNQPRRNAAVVGTVPQNSEITVNLCLTASDGVWCRAGFGEIAGWMAKSAIRADEWPVITFVEPG